MSRNSFSKPNLTPKSTFKKAFPIEVGKNNVYRLMPAPMEQSSNGDWFLYQKAHFGYSLEKEINGEKKLIPAPFLCVEVYDFKNKKILEHCPECDSIRSKKADFDDLAKVHSSKPENQKKLLLGPLEGWIKKHTLNKHYYVHAMNEARQFSFLKLGKTVFGDLRTKIRKFDQDGLNAFDFDTGLWWNFTRVGETILDTKYSVEVVQETVVVDNRKLLDYKRAPLTEDEINQAASEALNLKTLYPSVSLETIKQLNQSSGSPEEVAAILGSNQKRNDNTKVLTTPTLAKTNSNTNGAVDFDPSDSNVSTETYLKVFGE